MLRRLPGPVSAPCRLPTSARGSASASASVRGPARASVRGPARASARGPARASARGPASASVRPGRPLPGGRPRLVLRVTTAVLVLAALSACVPRPRPDARIAVPVVIADYPSPAGRAQVLDLGTQGGVGGLQRYVLNLPDRALTVALQMLQAPEVVYSGTLDGYRLILLRSGSAACQVDSLLVAVGVEQPRLIRVGDCQPLIDTGEIEGTLRMVGASGRAWIFDAGRVIETDDPASLQPAPAPTPAPLTDTQPVVLEPQPQPTQAPFQVRQPIPGTAPAPDPAGFGITPTLPPGSQPAPQPTPFSGSPFEQPPQLDPAPAPTPALAAPLEGNPFAGPAPTPELAPALDPVPEPAPVDGNPFADPDPGLAAPAPADPAAAGFEPAPALEPLPEPAVADPVLSAPQPSDTVAVPAAVATPLPLPDGPLPDAGSAGGILPSAGPGPAATSEELPEEDAPLALPTLE